MEIVMGCLDHEDVYEEEPCAVYLAFEHGRIGLATVSAIFPLQNCFNYQILVAELRRLCPDSGCKQTRVSG